MELAEYPYKPKTLSALLVMLFFGACAVFIGNQANTNDRGLIIDRVIELSAPQATIFYWVLTGLCGVFVLLGLMMLVISFAAPRSVLLTEDSLISPKPFFSKKNIVIRYTAITKLALKQVKHQHFLMVHYAGKKISIPQSLLPNKAAFDELYTKLSNNVGIN